MTDRDFRSEYIAARLRAYKAKNFSAQYAAETACNDILREAQRAGVDLLGDLVELDTEAMRKFYEELTDEDLTDLLRNVTTRKFARDELNRRYPL